MDITSHHIAYSLLINDFRKVLEYVHPTQSNFGTYSHRIYELFFRTCTEFENACKEVVMSIEPNLESRKLTIDDYYKGLYEKFTLEKYVSGLKFFDGGLRHYSIPFEGWTKNQPLVWYQSYNRVKHNRASHFHEANLINLIDSLAGLTIIEYKIFRKDFFTHSGPVSQRGAPILFKGKQYFETDYSTALFTIASRNRDEFPF